MRRTAGTRLAVTAEPSMSSNALLLLYDPTRATPKFDICAPCEGRARAAHTFLPFSALARRQSPSKVRGPPENAL